MYAITWTYLILVCGLVAPSGAQTTDHFSSSSSVFSRRLHHPPVVLEYASLFLTPDLFSKYSVVALFFCGLVFSTAKLVWQCCRQWCKQDQILKTKTKITRPRPRPLLTRPRPPEVNKDTWRI